MSIINFSTANCQSCYVCVRTCPVQAVKVKKDQAEILETRCIGCGLCLKVCPKNAKKIESELKQVKKYIKQKETIIASIAPTFPAVFGEESNKVVSALKQLGFSYVEETVVGASDVSHHYQTYVEKDDQATYLTSCCPSINYLVQKHHPNLIHHLVPVVSPMVNHARLLKQKYGETSKVVFIGPCLSKKLEGLEDGNIDAVITFEELVDWLHQEAVHLNRLDSLLFDGENPNQRSYPIVGGIARGFKNELGKEVIHVDGLDDCIAVLKAIEQGHFDNTFIEMSSCRHGCVGGPALPNDELNVYERKRRIEKYAFKEIGFNEEIHLEDDQHKVFLPLKAELNKPSDQELRSILESMGKFISSDELNCSSCGYETCHYHAIAIYNKMAEPSMCVPYMKKKAETLANVIFEATPNVVLLVDPKLDIIEFNPAAERFFGMSKSQVIQMPVSIVLDDTLFKQVIKTKQPILSKRISINDDKNCVIQSTIYIDSHDFILCIIHDITNTVKHEEWKKNLQINAIDMAQQVINKQMRVAQEIASLLGETTAETKVTLTRLKELMIKDEVD